MADTPPFTRTVTLSLSQTEQWTLHHVLLDRLEQEASAGTSTHVEPPPVAVFRAFETLDAGATTFTLAQLDAIQDVLAAAHHAPTREDDRSQVEQLLQRVTTALAQSGTVTSAD